MSSRQQLLRDRENRAGQEEVRYGPQHFISKQTESALDEHIKANSGMTIRQLLKKIPGVAARRGAPTDAD